MATDILKFKKSNCKNCYRCIRHCPVKSIRFSDNQAHIIKNECILCGMCFVNCPQDAKQIRDDVYLVKEAIAQGKKVIASVAPSFVAFFDNCNIESFDIALKKLGFLRCEETARGATAVKMEYERLISENKNGVLISSCCHTVNTLISKYHPNALPYLANVMSPMQAHGKMIRENDEDAYIVFIGPCISKKAEVEEYPGIIDCSLTFDEILAWLNEENIQIDHVESGLKEGRARIFPTTGGVIHSMLDIKDDVTYIAIDGVENCINALKDIETGTISNCFVEMSACVGSCINGPVMLKEAQKQTLKKYISVKNYTAEDDFKISLNSDLHKKFESEMVDKEMPGSAAIAEILKKMGKTSPDKELNCGSCGYDTCREKAVAVLKGKADFSMCLPYLKGKAESFSDKIIKNTPNGIMVLNENLIIQEINKVAADMVGFRNNYELIGESVVSILNPADYVTVLSTGENIYDKKQYFSQFKRYIEETIIYDKDYHIILSIMRDVTKEESDKLKKDELKINTIEITDKVIEKQMRVVQEIASLLGETTAETKIALTNLKDTLNSD